MYNQHLMSICLSYNYNYLFYHSYVCYISYLYECLAKDNTSQIEITYKWKMFLKSMALNYNYYYLYHYHKYYIYYKYIYLYNYFFYLHMRSVYMITNETVTFNGAPTKNITTKTTNVSRPIYYNVNNILYVENVRQNYNKTSCQCHNCTISLCSCDCHENFLHNSSYYRKRDLNVSFINVNGLRKKSKYPDFIEFINN